ncbi:SDR family oxidoreductase [Rhizobium sp. EC-SD404]|uniref:SDR family oxidoreductase n=1 Tax=Rhizobium sp. EC-SD404 TaxID=2038389 RepID=UPI0012595A0A|nr:SDR family oxidoreductase [Rhizobium sp. EC-SD404]VVT26493.1 Short-chain dehydrogenase [Rhizobium sp. EC-SD404]
METYLITGVGRGIGFQLARQALASGARVIGSVRTAEQAEELRSSLGSQFDPVLFDVTDRPAIERAASLISGPIDCLIHCAGIIGPERQSTLDMDFAGFEHTLIVNTLAPLHVIQAFLPKMRASERGRILVLSSRMGSLSYAKSDHIAYRASKAALNKVLQGLATDLLPRGIAVAAVHPGWVRTDMGGTGADIDAATSASGILQLAADLDLKRSGRFWAYDGSELAW